MTIDFKWIIDHIPEIVMLVLPGYIFLVVFKFCEAGKRGNINPISIESLIASYIIMLIYTAIKAIVSNICNLFYTHTHIAIKAVVDFLRNLSRNDISNTIILLIFSVSIGAWLGHNLAKQSVKEFIEKHLKVSLYTNPWLEMPNGKEGDYVDVHLDNKNICYRGWFNTHFEHDGATWIVIGDYIQIDPLTKQELKDAGCNIDSKQEFRQPPQIIINMKDITRIEFLGIPKDSTDHLNAAGKQEHG